MAEQAADNEPSMEEILSSIRRIINEDDAPAEAAAPAPEPAPAPAPEPASVDQSGIDDIFGDAGDDDDGADVLELTDRIDEPSGGTDPAIGDDDLMIVDREDDFDEVIAEAPEPAPAPAPAVEPDFDFDEVEADVEDAIMSAPAASAAMGSFHTLADTIRISDEEGRTLEGVVRALLRPMLKDWLDTNLPAIVDEKVQAEIDRVSRRRR